jgi:hypothetical protein
MCICVGLCVYVLVYVLVLVGWLAYLVWLCVHIHTYTHRYTHTYTHTYLVWLCVLEQRDGVVEGGHLLLADAGDGPAEVSDGKCRSVVGDGKLLEMGWMEIGDGDMCIGLTYDKEGASLSARTTACMVGWMVGMGCLEGGVRIYHSCSSELARMIQLQHISKSISQKGFD